MSSKFSGVIGAAALTALPFLFPGLFPLSWIALVPLFWLVERVRLREAFLCGWGVGVLVNLAGFYWLPYTIRVFGGLPYALSGVVFLLYALLEALQFALFAGLVRLAGFGPLLVFPALLWVALEFFFPHLFPWYLANAQTGFLPLIQSADLVGPYGVSFLLVWSNAVVYALVLRDCGRRRACLAAAAIVGLLVLGSVIYGMTRLSIVAGRMARAPKLSLAAVQGNIGVGLKWDPAEIERNLAVYRELTKNVSGVSLVIWPETAVEAWVPDDSRRVPDEILPRFAEGVTDFLFGARSYRGDPKGSDFAAFNSAFLVGPQGGVAGRYHKQVLLAFGEYMPFGGLLSKIPGVPPIGSFSRGDGPRTLTLSSGARLAPLICYEDLLPPLSRRFVADAGAQLLVNLTNDAWYGRSHAPWQHARMAQWRAIETRRMLVRVTNTGVTAIIDAGGAMTESLPLFTAGVLTAQVALLEGKTFYVRYGDWFAWAATLLALAALIARALRKGG
jgi:apolipoprotein N-acyltransferase